MGSMGSVCGKPVVIVCCTGVQQCPVGLDEQVEPDELVIATSLAITSVVRYHDRITHTHFPVEKTSSSLLQEKQDIFRYCSSSINTSDVSYKDESNKCVQGECLVVDMVQVVGRQVTAKDDNFAVNCVAVQESYRCD